MKRIPFVRFLVVMATIDAGYIGNNFTIPNRFLRDVNQANGETTQNRTPFDDDAPIISKQFDENTTLQFKHFHLPPINSSVALNETHYSELKEISDFKFTGFGPNGNDSLFLKFGNHSTGLTNELVNSPAVVGCKLNQILRPVCASDGKMYRNLGHVLCVKRDQEELEVVWDGPCNRSEWPTAKVLANGTKIKVLNPGTILKYIKANDMPLIL